jgi:hypothetical protein
MLEHRAALQQQPVQQEADGLRRLNLDREQVLNRLWEIANLSPEMTRGSITGQVKALSMIVAMENFIPDRRATSQDKKSPPGPAPQIYASAWRREQQATNPAATNDPQPNPAPAQEEAAPRVPAFPGMPWKPAPGSPAEAPSDPSPNRSIPANPFSSSEATAPAPYGPELRFVPDARGPFSNLKNPFARPR